MKKVQVTIPLPSVRTPLPTARFPGVGATAGQGLIRIVSAERVTMDGSFNGSGRYLTLTNTGTTTPVTLQIAFATDVTIKNLNISTGINSAASTAIVSNSGNNPNLILENNNITKAYTGISVSPPATSLNTGLIIRNNTIGSATAADYVAFRGISLINATAALISGNTISVKTALSVNIAGIEVGAGATDTRIDANTISGVFNSNTSGYGAYGINLLAGTGHIVSNNMISDISMVNYNNSTTTWNPFGIRIEGGTNHKIYYNSINMAGALPAPTATHFSAPLLVVNSTVTGLDIRNNIFANTITGIASGKSFAIHAPTGTTFANINYNDYFVSGANGIIGFLGAERLTLADWKTATGQDANSVSVEPIFMSPTDLHLESSNLALNNVGTPIAGITTDFDNQTRNATTPDIGADEFTPASLDLGAFALVSPVAKNCFGAAEPVVVSIKNLGITPINFATTNATLTVTATVPTGAPAATFPVYTLNSNTLNGGNPLAVGATLDVPVGTINMTTPGAYTFNAVTNVTSGGVDGNPANNDITPVTITVSPLAAGTASASPASVCQSGVTTLTTTGATGGDVQWQIGTSATGPFTDIAGATGSSFTLAAPISATTYYRAVVSCGTNSANSNTVTVSVFNPQIASVAGAARCDAGPVTLTATPSAGASVNWYATPTGGSILATGTTYTPTVTATTTFYAEPFEGGTITNFGLTSTNTTYGSFGSPGGTGYGLALNFTQPGIISAAYVYPVSAGNVIVQLYTRAGVAVGSPVTVAVSASDVGNKTLIPLNIPVPAAGAYNLVNNTGSVFLNRHNPYTGPAYPFVTLPVTVEGGVLSAGGAPSLTTYYSFFDLTYNTGCATARTAVVATVNSPAATPTVTAGGATTFCTGGSVVLTAASATTGATYQWFNNGTAIAGATSATFTANAAGSYTVEATANGCASAQSTATTVTVNATPATPTISQNGGILTSSSATGNQWFLNGTPIAGATGQTYVTTTNGAYTLQVTANGCPSALSAVTNVTTSGVKDAMGGMSVAVYPNPTSGSFNVKLNGYQKEATVVLYNLAGQLIATDKVSADGKAKNIDIKGLAAGTYMLKVTSDKGVQVTRLVVQ